MLELAQITEQYLAWVERKMKEGTVLPTSGESCRCFWYAITPFFVHTNSHMIEEYVRLAYHDLRQYIDELGFGECGLDTLTLDPIVEKTPMSNVEGETVMLAACMLDMHIVVCLEGVVQHFIPRSKRLREAIEARWNQTELVVPVPKDYDIPVTIFNEYNVHYETMIVDWPRIPSTYELF